MTLSQEETDALLVTLQARFMDNTARHPGIAWDDVAARLLPGKLWSLSEMERTGGEPDLVPLEGALCFVDCCEESPAGRRSLCYDQAALDARKANKPAGSAVGMAQAMGVALLTEAHYRHLQTLGEFDTRTSSWIATPPAIRDRGGSLFADRRYDHVFVYHNGAQSYYAARGFRGLLTV